MPGKRAISIVFTAVCLLFIMLPFTLQAADNDDIIQGEKASDFIQGILQQQLAGRRISGAVISVVHGEEIIHEGAAGRSNWEGSEKLDPRKHMVRTGTVGKVFTWAGIMQQVERGNIELEEDINQYLPEELRLEYEDNEDPVTLAEIMSHRAGFERRDMGHTLTEEDFLDLSQYIEESGYPARAYAGRDIHSYSNHGATLAGAVLEEATDQSYEDYLQEEIFAPLWMRNSTAEQPPADRERLSSGHRTAAGSHRPVDFEYIQDIPAGGHSVTARDMANFMRAIMPRTEEDRMWRIISEDMIEKLFSPRYSPHPRAAGWTYVMKSGEFFGEPVIWHKGDTEYFNSGLYFLPDRDLGIFVSYNGGEGKSARRELVNAFIGGFLAEGESQDHFQLGADEDLSEYAGRYYTAPASYTTPEKVFSRIESTRVKAEESRLLVSDEDKMTYYPHEEGEKFISQDGSSSLIFLDDGDDNNNMKAVWGEDPTRTLVELSLLESPLLHLGITLLAFLAYIVTPLANIKRLLSGAVSGLSRKKFLARWPGIMLSALGIIFIVFQSYHIWQLYHHPGGWPEWMGLINLIPIVMAVLLLIILYQLIREGIMYSNFFNQAVLLFISAAFLGVLYYYNFIGFLVFH